MEVKEASAEYSRTSGYKSTEVGVIPDDWEVLPLGALISSLEAGVSVNSVDSEKDVYAHEESVLKTSCVIGGRFLPEENKKILPRDIHRAKANPRQDSILISRMNTPALVGESGYVARDYPNLFLPDRLWMTRHNVQKSPCVRWLAYVLAFELFNRVIKESATGTSGSMKNISKGALLGVQIPLPTKAEQEAIAEVLSDADALIESLEQLLAKKRHLKQGAMQQLLTGKKRLPGFSGEWEVKRLGELADIRSGGTPTTTQSQLWDGDILWCTPTDITALNGYKYLSDTSRKITQLGLKNSSAEMIPVGSIVMTSRATIGECAINKVPVSTNQGFKNFVPFESVDVEFLYYLLLTQKQGFITLCGGSTFLEIGKTQLAIYEVKLPVMKTEQTAIATILSDMDAELAALEAKLAKARNLKQGMMQELLTGRIRLV